MRNFVVMAIMLASLSPGLAQQQEAPWQATVTGQIEALRAGDSAAALALAGAGFRNQFEDQPEAFFATVLATGYEPVVRSRSHSFGEFTRLSETVVAQVVLLVGPEQGLYEALYQLQDEADGWRVSGVVLRKQQGVAI